MLQCRPRELGLAEIWMDNRLLMGLGVGHLAFVFVSESAVSAPQQQNGPVGEQTGRPARTPGLTFIRLHQSVESL